MKNTADQIAQLRDKLIVLEKPTVILTEKDSRLKRLFGGGPKPAPIPTLRPNARATVMQKGIPVEYKLKNGEWKRYDDVKKDWVPTTPKEAAKAEQAALANPRQHADPAAQQSGAGAQQTSAAALQSVSPTMLERALMTLSSDVEFVKSVAATIPIVIRVGLGTASLGWTLWDIYVKTEDGDVSGAIQNGLIGFAATVLGYSPLKVSLSATAALALVYLAIKGTGKYPLTEEEKLAADKAASWYYNNRKTLNPSRDAEYPIPPRIWEATNRFYNQYQKQKPNPPTDGGVRNTAGPSGAPTPAATPSGPSGAPTPAATPSGPSGAAPAPTTPSGPSGAPTPAPTTPSGPRTRSIETPPPPRDEVEDTRRRAGLPDRKPHGAKIDW
jgi:hypothetical protein